MSWFIGEIFRRDPLLAWVGVINLALALGMVALLLFDTRLVTGINPWIKPIKFALSIALFTFTAAWYLGEVRRTSVLRSLVRWGIAAAMMIEIACIAMQAARGTTSHFNEATMFDAAVFRIMGSMIIFNTALAGVMLWLLRGRVAEARAAYLWGLRVGLALFVLASLQGLSIVSHGAHTVGLPDGGPGLPFLNWSTTAGDLRVAHFIGLHSIQVFPIVGSLLDTVRSSWSSTARVAILGALALVWFALVAGAFMQALAGRPFLPL